MDKFAWMNTINDEKFQRLTGIKRELFNKIVEILKPEEIKKFALGGKINKLSLENRILMMLAYWREYGSYFQTGSHFGISESNCYRNIRWIEDTLIKNPNFSLLGAKELIKESSKNKIFAIDASESPIQRPKKDKNHFIQEKRKFIHESFK